MSSPQVCCHRLVFVSMVHGVFYALMFAVWCVFVCVRVCVHCCGLPADRVSEGIMSLCRLVESNPSGGQSVNKN